MEIPESRNIKYQVRICNEIMLDTMLKLKCSGFDEEQIKMLLKLIGEAYGRCSFSDNSIDYHINHLKEALLNN